jgi:predicted dehydrogenase
MLIQQMLNMALSVVAVYGHRNREKFPHLSFVESVNEVVAASDAVLISVPPQYSAELCLVALEAGRHLFVEKPMVSTMEEAEELQETVVSSGVTFMVGHQLCYSDAIPALLESDWAFAVGRLLRAPSSAPMNPYWNIGSHLVALFDVAGVKNFGLELLFDPRFGDQGYQIFFWDKEGNELRFEPGGPTYRNELQHFVDCIKYGTEPLTNIHHGVRVIKRLSERYGPIDYLAGD